MLPGMLNDQKRIAAIILGDEKGNEKEVKEPKDQVGLMAAAEEIMSAVKTNSLSSLVGALKSFIELCGQEHEGQEEMMEEGKSYIQDSEME